MEEVLRHERGRWKPLSGSRPAPDDNWPYRRRPQSGDDPQYGVKRPKMERHLYIRRDQVLYDIDAQIGMLSDGRRQSDGSEDETLTGATTKWGGVFNRWISKHIGEAKTTMSAMVLERFTETAMNGVTDDEETDITLLVPEWYDDTVWQQLCDAVHSYVVTATLADFLTQRLTSKDAAAQDKQLAKYELESEIRKLVNMAKPGRIGKPLKPF